MTTRVRSSIYYENCDSNLVQASEYGNTLKRIWANERGHLKITK